MDELTTLGPFQTVIDLTSSLREKIQDSALVAYSDATQGSSPPPCSHRLPPALEFPTAEGAVGHQYSYR